jgi:hypothetical protein
MNTLNLNSAETEGLVRCLDGITEIEGFHSVELQRRDSFDMPFESGFLIVTVRQENGDWAEDAISETGSVSHWSQGGGKLI